MQHQDEAGKGLLDAVFPNGPIWEAQEELMRRVFSDTDAVFPLSSLVYHFEPHVDIVTDDVFRVGFCKCFEVAAQVWSRMQTKYESFPWCLLGIIDDRNSDAHKAKLQHDFATLPDCELDPGFSLPLRSSLANPDSLREHVEGLLKALALKARPTNMGIERHLAEVKRSCPTMGRHPTVERMSYCGHLAQFLRRHSQRGHEDLRGPARRKRLKASGVAIRAARPKGTSTRPRWHLRYANATVHQQHHVCNRWMSIGMMASDFLSGCVACSDVYCFSELCLCVVACQVAAYRRSGEPCGPREIAEVRAEANADWQAKPVAERHAWQAAHPVEAASIGDDADDEAVPVVDSSTPWEREMAAGSGWPVGPGHLQALLDTVSTNSGVIRCRQSAVQCRFIVPRCCSSTSSS
jgi:hypothetical protein